VPRSFISESHVSFPADDRAASADEPVARFSAVRSEDRRKLKARPAVLDAKENEIPEKKKKNYGAHDRETRAPPRMARGGPGPPADSLGALFLVHFRVRRWEAPGEFTSWKRLRHLEPEIVSVLLLMVRCAGIWPRPPEPLHSSRTRE